MDPRESELPDHPEDPFPPPAEQVPPPAADDDADDFLEDENEEDDEATLDEEEAMLEDDDDELDDLEAEADMDIEELRKKYGYGAPAPTEADDEPCVSSTAAVGEGEEEEPVNIEAIESAANDYFGVAADAVEAEEEDVDYEPPEKKEFQIRVDPLLYQAAVPEELEGVAASAEHPQGTLLWSPNKDLPSTTLDRFVHEWKAMRAGVERDEEKIDSRDDEDALFALLASSYSTDAAVAAFPGPPANQCEKTIQGEPKEFSAEEMAAFERGFKDNYKNFRVIRESFVPSRTLGELINYYYNWKCTPRYNELFRQRQQRKDFMTEVHDQMESSKRRREAAVRASEAAASTTTTTTVVGAVMPLEEDEVEYEDPLAGGDDLPPVDLWAAAPPPPQHHEQPTESA